MKIEYGLVCFIFTCLCLPYTYAEETVNERLIRVEESIKSLDMRLTQRIEDTNKRIDELRQDINRRFDDSSKDIDDIRSLMHLVMASLFAIIAMICGLIVYIVRKDRQESQQLQQFDPTLDLKNSVQKVMEKVDALEYDFREKVIPLWDDHKLKYA